MRYLKIFTIILLLAACGKKAINNLAAIFNTNNLPKETFELNTSKGANFTTKNGTQIIIPAGSIKAATDTVSLAWQ